MDSILKPIPNEKLAVMKKSSQIPVQARNLLSTFIFNKGPIDPKSKLIIQGTFSFTSQPNYGDIDTIYIVKIDANKEDSLKIAYENIKNVVKRITNHQGWFLTDVKCGKYSNGKAVHWTASEIRAGKRNGKPDVRGVNLPKTFMDGITDIDEYLKIDYVAPYFGRYIECSCIYVIDTKNGFLNISKNFLSASYFLKNIRADAKENYEEGRYYKTIKRIFSQAKISGDYKTLSKLQPILISNVGKLSVIVSDLKTLELLVEEKKKFNAQLTGREFEMMKEKMSFIIDIDFNESKIDDGLQKAYEYLIDRKLELFYKTISSLDKKISNTVNSLAKKYIDTLPKSILNKYL